MEVTIEDTTIDAAKSSLVYNITQSLSSPGKAASSSFGNQVLRGVPQDFGRQLLQQIQVCSNYGMLIQYTDVQYLRMSQRSRCRSQFGNTSPRYSMLPHP